MCGKNYRGNQQFFSGEKKHNLIYPKIFAAVLKMIFKSPKKL